VIYGVPTVHRTNQRRHEEGAVARDPDTIQREIERSRDALAASLDVLSTRVSPRKLADDGRQAAAEKLADPKIKYALIAVGALVAVALVRSIFR
jgi:Protein of unknown function (DUF3618)